MRPQLITLLALLSLLAFPACGEVADDDDSSGGDDDDATGDDDDATGDDDDATGDDDDDSAAGDDDDDSAAGDDDDSAAGDDDDSAAVTDVDGDGFEPGEDCNDGDPAISPDAAEICGSGVDEDCAPATNCDDTCLPSFDYNQCAAPWAVVPSPTLHWSYDVVTSTTVTDEGTSLTDGALVGAPTFLPGFNGDAVDLDGSSWVFASGSVALPGAGFTMVTWVRVAAGLNAGPHHFLMSTGNGLPAYTGAGIFLSANETTGGLLENGAGAGERLPVGAAVCDGGWAQVALTFDAGLITLWVDGVANTPMTAGWGSVVWGARPFGIGNDPNNTNRALIGQLDETMAFSDVLSADQLGALRGEALCAR